MSWDSVTFTAFGSRNEVSDFVKKAKGKIDTIWDKTISAVVLEMIDVWKADKSISFEDVCARMCAEIGIPTMSHTTILPATDPETVENAVKNVKANLAAEIAEMKADSKTRTNLNLISLCPPTPDDFALPREIRRDKWLRNYQVDVGAK